MTIVPVTSADLDASEVSWFAALCSDDYAYLGVPDGALRSSWAHCAQIVQRAEANGFRNILCPSSYQVGQDTLSFVAGCAPITDKINLLAAVRCGEMQPIMLARTIATLDHMLEGRLTVNIISSDFPGEVADSAFRYQRSREVVEILKQAWTRDTIDYQGEVYQFSGVRTDPARPYQTGGPLLYFGGYSSDALELCGQHCDVYLMWPEPKEQIAQRMRDVNAVAERYGRTLDYGLRVHMIVRDTEAEARDYAEHLVSKLDDELGQMIRERALDSGSLGVSHQAKARALAGSGNESGPQAARVPAMADAGGADAEPVGDAPESWAQTGRNEPCPCGSGKKVQTLPRPGLIPAALSLDSRRVTQTSETSPGRNI